MLQPEGRERQSGTYSGTIDMIETRLESPGSIDSKRLRLGSAKGVLLRSEHRRKGIPCFWLYQVVERPALASVSHEARVYLEDIIERI